jgi:hypothetical protein
MITRSQRVLRSTAIVALVLGGSILIPAAAAQASFAGCGWTYNSAGTGVDAYCHGPSNLNDQFRAFTTCYRAGHPSVKVYGPWTYAHDSSTKHSYANCAAGYDAGNGGYQVNY